MPLLGFYIDPNSTHRHFLEASVTHLTGITPPKSKIVLFEIGTGGESSRIMYEAMAANSNVYLVSFENDPKWLEIYKNMYLPHERHKFVSVSDDAHWTHIIKSELDLLEGDSILLSFIDSAPWESRSSAVRILNQRSSLVLIHDVDYFPHNQIFGSEVEEIKRKPLRLFRYGKLKSKFLGKRLYDDVFVSWVEVFPEVPGYFTGPPTLIGSNSLSVHQIILPLSTIRQGFSLR